MLILFWIIDSVALLCTAGVFIGYFVDRHYMKTRPHLFGPRLYGPSWLPYLGLFRPYVRRVRAFHDQIDQEDARYLRGEGYDVVTRGRR